MSVPTEHRPVVVEHSEIEAREGIFVTMIQGPPSFVRCACGWSAHADDVNIYTASKDHFGRMVF